MRCLPTSLLAAAVLAGCGGLEPADPTTTRSSALTLTLTPAADTFINSVSPDNNNGASPSIYTGTNGMNGLMRGLIRFAMPIELQGRVTVNRVTLTMVTRGLGATDTNPPAAAMEILHTVDVDWTEGTGFGDSQMSNTVGQPCGARGATWNQPDCAGGTNWAGGTVLLTTGATAAVPAAIEATVTWDSDAGNVGMVTDVQSWIDTPTANHGWRIMSDTEGTAGKAQRFYAREVAGKGPTLTISAACTDPDAGSTCTDGGLGGASGSGGGGGGGGGGTGSGGGCTCALSDRSGRSPGAETLLVAAFAWLAVRRRRRAR